MSCPELTFRGVRITIREMRALRVEGEMLLLLSALRDSMTTTMPIGSARVVIQLTLLCSTCIVSDMV